MNSTPGPRRARAAARFGATLRETLLAWTPAASLVVLALVLAPAPATAQSACGGFYTVGQGDTLVEIAQRCGVTLPALLAENAGVKDDMDFEVGHRLRVPSPESTPTPVQACGAFYSVRTGDTVAEIAAKCGLTIPLLIAANPPLPTPLGIHGGLRVRIPDVSRAAVQDRATVAAVRSQIIMGDDDAPDPAPEPAPVPSDDLVRVEGVLEAGRACGQVRDDEGNVFAIAGEISNAFGPGDRVVLMGLPTTDHECAHSPALELRILYRAGAA